MSEREKRSFYGDDERPSLNAVMVNLCALTGSEACAKELIEACDYVEAVCGSTMLMPMPDWIQ